jgi:hypothetical protein
MSEAKPSDNELINDSPILSRRITSLGRMYAMTADGHQYTKRPGSIEWTLVSPTTSEPPPTTDPLPTLQLLPVLEYQALGEPNHWSLFLAHEGENGATYQVTGDAEAMHYSFIMDTNPTAQSEAFNTAYVMATGLNPEQGKEIVETVTKVEPPSAPNAAAVKENCQAWCVKVLVQLMKKGIVDRGRVEEASGMLELVRGKVKPVIEID